MCKYCQWLDGEDADIQTLLSYRGKFLGFSFSLNITVEEDKIVLSFKNEEYKNLKTKQINYCPICGRDLRGL